MSKSRIADKAIRGGVSRLRSMSQELQPTVVSNPTPVLQTGEQSSSHSVSREEGSPSHVSGSMVETTGQLVADHPVETYHLGMILYTSVKLAYLHYTHSSHKQSVRSHDSASAATGQSASPARSTSKALQVIDVDAQLKARIVQEAAAAQVSCTNPHYHPDQWQATQLKDLFKQAASDAKKPEFMTQLLALNSKKAVTSLGDIENVNQFVGLSGYYAPGSEPVTLMGSKEVYEVLQVDVPRDARGAKLFPDREVAVLIKIDKNFLDKHGDLYVAHGLIQANKQYGKGGIPQVFIDPSAPRNKALLKDLLDNIVMLKMCDDPKHASGRNIQGHIRVSVDSTTGDITQVGSIKEYNIHDRGQVILVAPRGSLSVIQSTPPSPPAAVPAPAAKPKTGSAPGTI